MSKKFISFLMTFILLFTISGTSVSANTSYCYINGKKHYITQRNVSYNGTTIDLGSEPALVIEGYNYVPAKALIRKLPGISYSYDSSSKKITITSNNKTDTLILSLNSKSGTFNGKNITLSYAPVPVSFTSDGDYSVYIPAKETASYLGLTYAYANSGKKISYQSNINNNDTSTDNDNNDYTFKATITLARPSDISKGKISCTDDYHNKRMVITIPGNYTTFYNNNKPSLPSGVSFSHSYSSSTGKTSLIFTTGSINGWRVKENNNSILIMNGKPTKMFKNVIVLDPGHGGSDPGACYGNLYKEADFTLKIVQAATRLFEKDNNYKVYSTRLSNALPSGISKVWDRRTFANNLNADIFVSVHINSYLDGSATGTETLYNSKHNVSNSGGLSCYKLASIVQKYMQTATGFKDRGVKVDSTLSVLNNNNNPAVLTEVGFISNLSEAKKMAANLDAYGEAIYKAIINACGDYPTGR